MLVHIVNSGNRSFYSEYLNEIQYSKGHNLNCKFLCADDEELDFDDNVEYLLVIDTSGELIDFCRCNPTTKPHLLNGAFSHFLQSPIENGYDCWEYDHSRPIIETASKKHEKALAYFCIGILEWALTKGIKRLVSVAENHCIEVSKQIGMFNRLLGAPCEYDEGKIGAAVELNVTKKALDSARIYFGIDAPVTFTSPPQMDYRTISVEQIKFIDAAYRAAEFEGQNYQLAQ